MKKLIKKALEWVQNRRDERFKKRIERYFNNHVVNAYIVVRGAIDVNGTIIANKIGLKEQSKAKPKKVECEKKRSTSGGCYSTGGKTASGKTKERQNKNQ